MAAVDGYRPTISMRPDLREECGIYLEERSYLHAISLFQSLLASSSSSDRSLPTIVPSPDVLALLATVTVHPSTTSRPSSSEAAISSELALQYLYDLLEINGARNGRLGRAFRFRSTGELDPYASTTRRLNRRQLLQREEESRLSGSGRKHTAPEIPDDSASESGNWDESDLATPLAQKSSLFRRAEDFWDVVGWSFNCAVRHAHRWRYWRAWLEFMIDVLQSDWQDRQERASQVASDDKDNILRDSLVASYLLKGSTATQTAWRRILRAIFADGSSTAMKEFDEVWKDETKRSKTDEEKLKEDRERRKRKLDLDEGDFGVYGEDGDDGDDDMDGLREGAAPRKRGGRTPKAKKGKIQDWSFLDATIVPVEDEDPAGGSAGTIQSHGGAEAFALRRRLVALIMRVLSDGGTLLADCRDFLDIAASFITKQPMDLFLLWISPQRPASDKALEFSLDEFLEPLRLQLLIPLLPSRAASALAKTTHYTEQSVLQDTLLPLASASNARRDVLKLSLLIENLLLSKWSNDDLQPTEDLRQALESGIAARAAKPSARTSGKGTSGIDEEEWLANSAQRMRMMVDAVGAP